MPAKTDFPAAFAELRAIMQPYEPDMLIVTDTADNYYLNTKTLGTNKKPLAFGAVQIKKNYVAFHLFPLYLFPDLIETCSDALKKKMQGKTCFNFKAPDDALIAELRDLTARGYARMQG
mgnify:CR=1 FL=1